MVEVHRGRDARLGRTVVIKVLPEGDYIGEMHIDVCPLEYSRNKPDKQYARSCSRIFPGPPSQESPPPVTSVLPEYPRRGIGSMRIRRVGYDGHFE